MFKIKLNYYSIYFLHGYHANVTAARAAVRCSWGYRLMASTDEGGVNVTAERPQEGRTWRASERDGHGPRF